MIIEITYLRNTFFVILLCFTGSCLSAPATGEEIVYDQRQNGSENYRLHVNDIVIVHAPLEALVALASFTDEDAINQQLLEIMGGSSITDSTNTTEVVESTTNLESSSSATSQSSASADSSTSESPVTPVPSADNTNAAPTEEKPDQEGSQKPIKKFKSRLRLANLLMPFLRRL